MSRKWEETYQKELERMGQEIHPGRTRAEWEAEQKEKRDAMMAEQALEREKRAKEVSELAKMEPKKQPGRPHSTPFGILAAHATTEGTNPALCHLLGIGMATLLNWRAQIPSGRIQLIEGLIHSSGLSEKLFIETNQNGSCYLRQK